MLINRLFCRNSLFVIERISSSFNCTDCFNRCSYNSKCKSDLVRTFSLSSYLNVLEGSKKKEENYFCSELFDGVDYRDVVGEDEEMLKKLKVVVLEMDVMKQDGLGVPSRISVDRWKELLAAPTKSQRLKLLHFLFINEKKRLNEAKKKAAKREEAAAKKDEVARRKEENGHIHYGFGGSTIVLRVYDTTIDAQLNRRLVRAMQFGQKLVMDCDYDRHMTPKESALCAKQLGIVFSENRKHDDPFDLHLCNARPDTTVMRKLNITIPTLYNPEFPLNISPHSYLDLFPKERLVYLTPHCRQELTHFDHDDIYIIGCMVDKANSEPLSLAKAKREGLRMAKLPLDKHLLWHIGSKSLTLNQMLLIMLELKTSGDWSKALKHVPRRKVLQEGAGSARTKGPPLYKQRLSLSNML